MSVVRHAALHAHGQHTVWLNGVIYGSRIRSSVLDVKSEKWIHVVEKQMHAQGLSAGFHDRVAGLKLHP
jgi:hypothetical protein